MYLSWCLQVVIERSTLLGRGATAQTLDLGELDYGNSPVASRTRLIARVWGNRKE